MNNIKDSDVILLQTVIDNMSKEEMLDLLSTEKDKKIGLFLWAQGYSEAIRHATNMIDKEQTLRG